MNNKKIFHAKWIIPVKPDGKILKNHSLEVTGSRISNVIKTDKWKKENSRKNILEYDYTNMAIIPGFVNTHTHSAMSLLRGFADDKPLKTWLENYIWPVESKLAGKQFVQDGTRLAIAEMLLSGTTCFNDMYFFPEETVKTAIEMGMRATVGMIVIKYPSIWARDENEYFRKGQEMFDNFRNHPLINFSFAPHAPYSVSDKALTKIGTLSEELDVPIHIHLHETKNELEESKRIYNKSPILRLDSLKLLSKRLVAAHVTKISDSEIKLISESGTSVIHCPRSNLKLGSGIAPISKMKMAGVNICIGTDSCASNNDLDFFNEMRTAALLAKGYTESASDISAQEALEMATYNGALALGLEDKIGSLEKGKCADFAAIKFGEIGSTPVYNPVSQIVYSGQNSQVQHVWIEGKQVVDDRKVLNNDIPSLLRRVSTWETKIAKVTS